MSLRRLCAHLEDAAVYYPEPSPAGPTLVIPPPPAARKTYYSPKENPNDLAVQTVAAFNRKTKNELNLHQQEGLAVIELWSKAYTGVEMTRKSTKEIKFLILSFSRVFLLGDLDAKRIAFRFLRYDLQTGGPLYGVMHHGRNNSGICAISLDRRDHSDTKNVDTHLTALLSTLFHESVHAYFSAFCCDLTDHEGKMCSLGNDKWADGSGHFFAWFHLAAGVEIAVNEMLQMGTDLAVFRSLILEYNSPKGQKLTVQQWRHFFDQFGWENIDRMVRKLGINEWKSLVDLLSWDQAAVCVFLEELKKEDLRRSTTNLNSHVTAALAVEEARQTGSV